MKKPLFLATLLGTTATAASALAIEKPPPGVDPTLTGAAGRGSSVTLVGTGVFIVGGLAAGIWWLRSRRKDKGSG